MMITADDLEFSPAFEQYLATLSAEEAQRIREMNALIFDELNNLLRGGHGLTSHEITVGGVSYIHVESAITNLLRTTGNSIIDVNARFSATQDSVFHILALFPDSKKIIEAFITHGANANAQNIFGDTPLLVIAQKMPDVTHSHNYSHHTLLDAGASMLRVNNDGHSMIDRRLREDQEITGTFSNIAYQQERHYRECVGEAISPWLDMGTEQLLKYATIDKHFEAMAPKHWVGKEPEALALIAQLPPYLQEELSMQTLGLREALGERAPTPLRSWRATVRASAKGDTKEVAL